MKVLAPRLSENPCGIQKGNAFAAKIVIKWEREMKQMLFLRSHRKDLIVKEEGGKN
ncbi:MAG: hypothetical protein Kow0088_23670 [Anaerolineales bacterium]